MWPHALGRDQELVEATSKLIPTTLCTQNDPKNKINTEQYHLRKKIEERREKIKDTHNIAVTGPGACLRLLPLPEVAHDVVEVLAHQLLHPLQPGESLR